MRAWGNTNGVSNYVNLDAVLCRNIAFEQKNLKINLVFIALSWHIVVSVNLKNETNNLMFIVTWNVINPTIQVKKKYNGSNN